jgi:hypothetical protein
MTTVPALQFDETDQIPFNLRFRAKLRLLPRGHPLDSTQSIKLSIRTSNIRQSLQFSEIFRNFFVADLHWQANSSGSLKPSMDQTGVIDLAFALLSADLFISLAAHSIIDDHPAKRLAQKSGYIHHYSRIRIPLSVAVVGPVSSSINVVGIY